MKLLYINSPIPNVQQKKPFVSQFPTYQIFWLTQLGKLDDQSVSTWF